MRYAFVVGPTADPPLLHAHVERSSGTPLLPVRAPRAAPRAAPLPRASPRLAGRGGSPRRAPAAGRGVAGAILDPALAGSLPSTFLDRRGRGGRPGLPGLCSPGCCTPCPACALGLSAPARVDWYAVRRARSGQAGAGRGGALDAIFSWGRGGRPRSDVPRVENRPPHGARRRSRASKRPRWRRAQAGQQSRAGHLRVALSLALQGGGPPRPADTSSHALHEGAGALRHCVSASMCRALPSGAGYGRDPCRVGRRGRLR